MSNQLFPWAYGTTGRYIVVDASGFLVVNALTPSGGYVYATGENGYPMCVDASGRLMLSSLSPGLGGGGDGESNTASNLGGVGLYSSKSGVDLRFKGLAAGSGIQLAAGASSVEIKTPMLIAKPFKTLTWSSGMTVDLAQYNNYFLQIGANNTTITSLTNPTDGGKYLFYIKQNNAGSKTLTFPSKVKWAGKTPIALTAASGSIDVAVLIYVAADDIYLASSSADFG